MGGFAQAIPGLKKLNLIALAFIQSYRDTFTTRFLWCLRALDISTECFQVCVDKTNTGDKGLRRQYWLSNLGFHLLIFIVIGFLEILSSTYNYKKHNFP